MNQREHYHHGDLRAALVAEGLKQLEEAGEAALSLRALAKAVGVSPNAPYRHFADKHALMGALAAEGLQRFADAIENAAIGAVHPIQALRAQGRAYLDFATQEPAVYRLMFSPLGYSLHSEPCQIASARAFQCLVTSAAQAQSSGWNTHADLAALVMATWSALHGWALIVADNLIPNGAPSPTTDQWLEVFFGNPTAFSSKTE